MTDMGPQAHFTSTFKECFERVMTGLVDNSKTGKDKMGPLALNTSDISVSLMLPMINYSVEILNVCLLMTTQE